MNNLDVNKKDNMDKFYGNVFKQRHGNGIFSMKSVFKFVVDDEYIQYLELSDKKDIEYSKVFDFDLLDGTDLLDLTWMKKHDVFALESNEQFGSISEIRVNIDNLERSSLPVDKILTKHILLTVYGGKSRSNIIQQSRNFKNFISEHSDCLSGVKLEGFSSITESLLSIYVKNNGLSVYTDDHEKTMHR